MFQCTKLSFCVVFYGFIITCVTQELKYEVVAPEFICSSQKLSQTAIRLIGEDVPYLKYNWSVSFHLDELKESRNLKHRRTIMVWRSCRKLNKILQAMSKEEIDQGAIFINNSMLIPNVKYFIKLNVQKQQNGTIQTGEQQMSLRYIGKSSKISTLTVYLSGPEVTYSDMSYTAKAAISSCNDNSDYQLSWQLLEKSKKILREEITKSHILQLPSGTFSSGKEYFIRCLVQDKKANKNKTSEALRVNVLERGMQISTYTKYLKIGIAQPIYLNAFFSDPDGIAGDLMFEWNCSKANTEQCENFENRNGTKLSLLKGFSTAGRYMLTVTAKKGSTSVKDSSVVEVVEEMLPIIDIENAMTYCNPSDGVQISAHISRLVPGCTLQWVSVQDDASYNFINLNSLSGKPGSQLELAEDENNLETEETDDNEEFIEEQHDLSISSSDDGSWEGLQGNSKYLFRLIASCPCLENDTSLNSREQRFVTSTADVVVTTNQLPILKPLKVSPKSGQAIKTAFNFETGQPYNSSKPLLYKYGIINKSNKKLYLIQQYDATSAVTILPFYDESVETVLEVCDSRSACNFTLGPKVIVKLPNNFTVAEIDSLINNLKNFISEKDYFNAFTLSSMLLHTASQMPSNNTFVLFDNAIKNMTKQEIKSLLSATDNSWLLPAANLLKHIKILDYDIRLRQDTLNDILALRDKISEKQNSLRKKLIKSEKLVAPSRKLLSFKTSKKSKRIVNEISIDEVKDYLEISELAIKRLTDFERVDTEKQKLREKLQYYIPRICQYLHKTYKTNVRIELSTVVFDVERINLARKFNEFMFAPFEMDLAAKLQIGRDLAEKYRRKNGICLGKILFIEDYFNVPQFVYEIKLFSAFSNDFLETEINNFGVIIEMPAKSVISSDQTFQCVLWKYGDWDMSQCRTLDEYAGKVKCACKSLGYFSMVPVERTTTTSTTTAKATTTTTRTTTTVKPTTTTTTTTTSSTALGTRPVPEVELITQQYNAEIEALTTVTNEQSHATVSQPSLIVLEITSTELATDQNKQNQAIKSIQSSETSVNSAAVWSISLLTIGIFTLLLAFLVLLRKLQRSKAVQSFQTIEYARYFDEQNLE